jgi:uncharacterized protein (TIGR03066 family)
MIVACGRAPNPAVEPPATPLAQAKLLVGDWEARVPEKSGGHYMQMMTFRADGTFEVLIPPVRGKEVRIKGKYRFESDGQLAMSIPGEDKPLQGAVKASSPDEV